MKPKCIIEGCKNVALHRPTNSPYSTSGSSCRTNRCASTLHFSIQFLKFIG